MATEKQIAANRANAKRSTGPRTAAGRKKSSRNALRHGLTCGAQFELSSVAMVNVISSALASERAAEDQRVAANDFAQAQEKLERIRRIRAEQWAKINLNEISSDNAKELKRLASLDRHERYALSERRKASSNLRKEQQPS